LTVYLDPDAGEKLFAAMVEPFPTGDMIFDLYGPLGIKLQMLNPIVRRAGATLIWGIDNPRELEKLGLTTVTCRSGTDFATPEIIARMSTSARLQLRIANAIPLVGEWATCCAIGSA
jgi:O-methyltransferase involved in polyketide biosynthesis